MKEKSQHPTRTFKKPEELYKLFKDYKENLKEEAKEWVKLQYVGKDAARKEDPLKVPMTFEGLKRFAYEKHGYIDQYFKNKDDYYTEFVPVCSRIKSEIRENQIIGGMLGLFNPSITQRLNGLVDKKEQNIKGLKLGKDYETEYTED